MCFLGVLGIVLMIIESELTFNRIDHKDTTFSLLIKATITFSTILLVGLVFYYHRIDLSLYCVDNSIDDWRIALTRTKIFSIILEAAICMIHPIPGHFLVEWSSQYVKKVENNFQFINPYRSGPIPTTVSINSNTTTTSTVRTTTLNGIFDGNSTTNSTDLPQSYVPIDVILSLPSKMNISFKSNVVFYLFLLFKCFVVCIWFVVSLCFILIWFVMHHLNH